MFVLPASMVSSISSPSLLPVDAARQMPGSGSDLHAPDDIAFGNRVPVPRGSADQRILTVEVRVAAESDEKLARAGIAARERHAHGERIERARRRLAAEWLSSGAAETVAARVSELHDEAGNDPVNDDAVVKTLAREVDEARDGDGRDARVERNGERAGVRLEHELDFP